LARGEWPTVEQANEALDDLLAMTAQEGELGFLDEIALSAA
jgi:hypothetical protein